MGRERPGALLARRTRTIGMCLFDARSRGQPIPLLVQVRRTVMNHASYARCPRIRLPHMMNKVILRTSGSEQEGIMSYLQQTIKAVIRPGDEVGYVAECLEIAVVTQGRTLDETVKHLQEATALHLEGEHLAAFGLREKPTLVLTMELDPAHAQAS
jgi:predicted RNase H-like HicB family nuclease